MNSLATFTDVQLFEKITENTAFGITELFRFCDWGLGSESAFLLDIFSQQKIFQRFQLFASKLNIKNTIVSEL